MFIFCILCDAGSSACRRHISALEAQMTSFQVSRVSFWWFRVSCWWFLILLEHMFHHVFVGSYATVFKTCSTTVVPTGPTPSLLNFYWVPLARPLSPSHVFFDCNHLLVQSFLFVCSWFFPLGWDHHATLV